MLASPATRTPWRRRWQFWRSPEDQATWARPALLGVTALAAFLYSFRSAPYLELYYAAAVRSMSMSWHNFFFGAFDPSATITIDKLPGAFWIQALSVRIFGLHPWAIVLPQILEGVLSVLVLFRVVRRLVGERAALIAALVLALSPANVALDRGNISDTLMVLCLLLALDATLSVVLNNSRWALVWSGVWVGVAFQAKMLEAWLVLPALWLLVAMRSTRSWRTVLARIGAMSVVVIVVSLSWMSVVSLIPTASRPYVDGSANNSEFHQVFVYNGFNRVGTLSPNQVLEHTVGLRLATAPAPSWDRLLRGSLGRDGGWLLPAAVLILVVGLIATRRRTRGDPWRCSFSLWGVWLVVLGVTFSVGSSLNSYYLAALSPAVAGLIGTGALFAWEYRNTLTARVVTLATVVLTPVYGVLLLPSQGEGEGPWIAPLVIVFALVALTLLWRGPRTGAHGATRAGVGVLCAVLVLPTIASATLVANGLGAFDTPFEPSRVAYAVSNLFLPRATEAIVPSLKLAQSGAPYLMATQSSAIAAPFIFETGLEVLPIGGFTGVEPSPTVRRIRALVNEGAFHLVLANSHSHEPALVWIFQHCHQIPSTSAQKPILDLAVYYCQPST